MYTMLMVKMVERLNTRAADLTAALDHIAAERSRGVSFKASTRKGEQALQYVATNLHSQLLYPVEHSGEAGCQRAPWKYDSIKVSARRLPLHVFRANPAHDLTRPPTIFCSFRRPLSIKCAALTVTVGAAAAHCMGFKGGGCRRLAERAMTECDQMSLDAYSDLQLELEQRRDVVFSQMLTAALTAFVDLVVVRWQDARWWATIAGRGWLLVIESLLSTQGAELGMVDDYAEAASLIEGVVLRIAPSPPLRAASVDVSHGGVGSEGAASAPTDAAASRPSSGLAPGAATKAREAAVTAVATRGVSIKIDKLHQGAAHENPCVPFPPPSSSRSPHAPSSCAPVPGAARCCTRFACANASQRCALTPLPHLFTRVRPVTHSWRRSAWDQTFLCTRCRSAYGTAASSRSARRFSRKGSTRFSQSRTSCLGSTRCSASSTSARSMRAKGTLMR